MPPLTSIVDLTVAQERDRDVLSLTEMLTHRCVEVFEVGAAGVLLANGTGVLQVIACSDDTMETARLMAAQTAGGPGLDAFRTGTTTTRPAAGAQVRWPVITLLAEAAGYRSFAGVPLRGSSTTIGSLCLFGQEAELTGEDLDGAYALSHITALSILHESQVAALDLTMRQLQLAMQRKARLEQAKGYLAARSGCDVETAFEVMRQYARRTNRRLYDVAADIVEGKALPLA